MAGQDNTTAHPSDMVRNGFEIVTRRELQDTLYVAMDELESVQVLLSAIERLAAHDSEIKGLASVAKNIAQITHNDLDVIKENAEKAGLLGELAPIDGSESSDKSTTTIN